MLPLWGVWGGRVRVRSLVEKVRSCAGATKKLKKRILSALTPGSSIQDENIQALPEVVSKHSRMDRDRQGLWPKRSFQLRVPLEPMTVHGPGEIRAQVLGARRAGSLCSSPKDCTVVELLPFRTMSFDKSVQRHPLLQTFAESLAWCLMHAEQ